MTPLGVLVHGGLPDSTYRQLVVNDPTLVLGCAIWSPDGMRLAFEGWDDTDPTRNGIYTLNALDGSDLQRLTSSPDGAHDIPGDYSADGDRLFFARWAAGHEGGPLMVVGSDGLDPRQVAADAYGVPSLSPDGTTLVADVNGGLRLIPVDGGPVIPIKIQPIPLKGFGPSWSPDGRWIVISVIRSGVLVIARIRPDGTGLFQISESLADEEFADWAP